MTLPPRFHQGDPVVLSLSRHNGEEVFHGRDVMAWLYLNGEIIAAENASISIDDRGFLLGDGAGHG